MENSEDPDVMGDERSWYLHSVNYNVKHHMVIKMFVTDVLAI